MKGVLREVARVLRPDGIIIGDFSNHPSMYNMIRLPRSWKNLIRYLSSNDKYDKYVHFGKWGRKDYVSQFGLETVCLHHLRAVPPLRNTISVKGYKLLDRYWPWQRVFARALLGVFINRKWGLVQKWTSPSNVVLQKSNEEAHRQRAHRVSDKLIMTTFKRDWIGIRTITHFLRRTHVN